MEKSRFLREETYAATRADTERAVSLDPDAYSCAEFFALEKTQVFGRNWVPIGPADQVQNAGDVMVGEVGGQGVFVVRGEDGQLRGFYNVCRHRGTRLCAANETGKRHIVCPYHGWGYNLRGECVGTPLFDKGANRRAIQLHDMSHLEGFDRRDYALFSVRVARWGVLVFVCLDESAPPLEVAIGDLPRRLANYRLEEWTTLGERTYEIHCNWKLLIENAVEYYHLPWVHPRLAKTSRVADHHRWQGTGMYCGICTSPVTATDDAGWLTMRNLSGLSEVENVSGFFFGLFPNAVVFVMPSHVFLIVANPVAADKTVEKAWLMSHPECVDDMSAAAIEEVMAFWHEVNLEDVTICEKVQAGVGAAPYRGGRLCYQFEEPVHRFQNMIADAMVGRRRVPAGDAPRAGE